jgi:hypothetical protein
MLQPERENMVTGVGWAGNGRNKIEKVIQNDSNEGNAGIARDAPASRL